MSTEENGKETDIRSQELLSENKEEWHKDYILTEPKGTYRAGMIIAWLIITLIVLIVLATIILVGAGFLHLMSLLV